MRAWVTIECHNTCTLNIRDDMYWPVATLKYLTGEVNKMDYLITMATVEGWDIFHSTWTVKLMFWNEKNGQVQGSEWFWQGPNYITGWLGQSIFIMTGNMHQVTPGNKVNGAQGSWMYLQRQDARWEKDKPVEAMWCSRQCPAEKPGSIQLPRIA